MRCVLIVLTPEAMKFAKANRKERTDFSRNKPLYCIHYKGSEFGSICVDLDTLDHVARLSKFPSRKLKENFLNNFLGTISFPEEAKLNYEWLYKPRDYDWYAWRYEEK